MCVCVIRTCESGGLAISLADSGHLAEGVWRQTLSVEHYNPYLRATSQMPPPLSRVSLHTGRDTLKWMRDDRRDVWRGWD